MNKPSQSRLVGTYDLVLAAVLLIGIALITFGTFGPSRTILYVGLLIVLGGVISGVIRIVVRGGGSR